MAAAYSPLYDGALEPIWFGDRKVYSVSGFVEGVRSTVSRIPSLWVQGEVSGLSARPNLSMVYFNLKDPENGWMTSCTMPRSRYQALGLRIQDGDLVQCYGRAEIYSKRGSFQLKVQSMEHAGRGLLMQQLEALSAKLAAEGLFDESRKKPLPMVPRRVGLITGAEAAAQGDFLRNVRERFPTVKLVMIETLVQGDRAAPQIVAALRRIEQVPEVDVIVVTRGGGAFEDFLPFSDERVCRAIAACSIPVVSAIGHEKDSPISDLVADLRVSTPTAAARTVVPEYSDLMRRLEQSQSGLRRRASERVSRRGEWLAAMRIRLTDRSPARVVEDRRRWLAALRTRAALVARAQIERTATALDRDRRDLARAGAAVIDARRTRHQAAYGRLRALSPQATIDRGYAIVQTASDGRLVRDVAALTKGDKVTARVAGGTLTATVEAVKVQTHDEQ